MRRVSLLLLIFLFSSVYVFAQNVTEGTLRAFGPDGDIGSCPLKHTDVKAEISGFLVRVNVKQEFENNFSRPIEAVYTFPLSNKGAVDDMTMTIGSRQIRGKILKREAAQEVYEAAKASGRTASLLDQERPNIFTQRVANILPGEKIVIEISYVETLKYEDGNYEFVFPMTVGPRYNPSAVKPEDAASISPPVAAKTRAGHDISISVNLNAGVPVESIRSGSHEIQTVNLSSNSASISLKNETAIPNKDFVLRYDVTGNRIEDALLTHRDARGGFFSLILQPPDKFTSEDVTPKEIVFVLDTSGSMSGFPVEKAKEAMRMSLEGLYPRDTFNLITFAGDTHVLFEKPVPATRANLNRAQEFLRSRSGGGGTEMMKAMEAAFAPSDSPDHLRIVCFMTDGYVGNEAEILAEIQKHNNARVFSFGIGGSVNRHLLDSMAKEGRGDVEYVALAEDGSKAAKRFHERIRNPLLTDISIDWNGLPVADVYPSGLADLYSVRPVILNGRYTAGASGTIKLKGKIGGQFYEREIQINLPEVEAGHDVLATLWARQRIDELTSAGYADAEAKKASDETITNIGLEFRLLTQFTSFVAVEERIVNREGQPIKIEVPVELAEGSFGDGTREDFIENYWRRRDPEVSGGVVRLGGQRSGRGSGNGVGPVQQSVTVTSNSEVVNSTNTTVDTGISTQRVEDLPRGRTFTALLKVRPGVQAESSGGGFQIDGASGSESVFVVDGTEVSNFRTGRLNGARDDDPITSSVADLPKPLIPQTGNWKKEDAVVNVEITVDETGVVAGAKALSGAEILKKPSVEAANKSKFTPPAFQGEPLRMSGVIVYTFIDKENVTISLDKMRVELTPAIERKLLLRSKLHYWLYDLVERLDSGETTPTKNEEIYVYKGKAEIQVILSENTPEIIAKLRNLGFEIDREVDVQITGRILIEKLADLTTIDQVRYISP